ncbi:MAG: TonB-dependent receptor, partial [Bacteroidota bacterium]|nr:TonB-dependent receptor [Bacteroidota bacterium]
MKGLRFIFIFILLSMFYGAFSQNKYTLSGTITDAESGEDLAGAVLSVQNTSYNTICNPYGFYSITIPEGNFSIEVQFVGYENQLLEVDLHSSKVINFRMKSVAYELENIEVRGKGADQNVTSLGMGSLKLNPKQIENIPVLFGERDLIKTMQLLPGVKQAGEGNAGFYVRGGGLDQNLILLDEAPVYNASHLLGFFSVF